MAMESTDAKERVRKLNKPVLVTPLGTLLPWCRPRTPLSRWFWDDGAHATVTLRRGVGVAHAAEWRSASLSELPAKSPNAAARALRDACIPVFAPI